MRQKKLILVISRDPHIADVRYSALVKAGYDVIAATDIRGVAAGCEAKPDAAMIGYSVPAPEKRRVWAELKKQRCGRILELHDGHPVLPRAVDHQAKSPDDFPEAIRALFEQHPVRKAARRSSE
jgi:CheY-like chemotaxis protein